MKKSLSILIAALCAQLSAQTSMAAGINGGVMRFYYPNYADQAQNGFNFKPKGLALCTDASLYLHRPKIDLVLSYGIIQETFTADKVKPRPYFATVNRYTTTLKSASLKIQAIIPMVSLKNNYKINYITGFERRIYTGGHVIWELKDSGEVKVPIVKNTSGHALLLQLGIGASKTINKYTISTSFSHWANLVPYKENLNSLVYDYSKSQFMFAIGLSYNFVSLKRGKN
jgi:hypothetical protein